MLTDAWNDVKQTTVVNCFHKVGLVVDPDEMCSDIKGNGVGCLDCEFQALVAFSDAVPDGATAQDILIAEDSVQDVADRNEAEIVVDMCVVEEANCTSDSDEDTQPPTAAKLA